MTPSLSDILDGLTEAQKQTIRGSAKVFADVMVERGRQISVEGWTPEHDDRHSAGQLAGAAASYAVGGGLFKVNHLQVPLQVWPYRWEWKPKGQRENLIRAAALLVAEIERLDREAASKARAGEVG